MFVLIRDNVFVLNHLFTLKLFLVINYFYYTANLSSNGNDNHIIWTPNYFRRRVGYLIKALLIWESI